MKNILIELNGVHFNYGNTAILDDISLSVKSGEFWTLIGPNGSGKSTLIQIMLGLLKPQSGTVKLFGVPIEDFHHRELIGYVSQKSNAFNSGFPATVLEVVRSGLTRKTGLFKSFTKLDDQQSIEALKIVGMEEYFKNNIGELSGGQQQRVFIARALVGQPELLIMDEPTVGIDVQNVQSFYTMLNNLNRDHGIAILLVTHEMDLVTDKATHVACLNRSMHFHGQKEDFKQMEDADISKWYGHPVRRVHQHERECDK
jgi:zinc transport system ATP-binding protein